MALAVLLLAFEPAAPAIQENVWFLYQGDADSARDLVSTLLSGMMTTTSLAVSITMVVLTLAAGQHGPRLIRTFISDFRTQGVLGLFIATILYLLLVLRSIDAESQPRGVPDLAVTVGSALVALSLFVLLFYVHKLARSTNADTVIEAVAADLDAIVSRRLPDTGSNVEEVAETTSGAAWLAIEKAGYVQTIDYEQLVDIASRADVVLRVEVRPGHYILQRGNHVAVQPAQALKDDLAAEIRSAFLIGGERTPTQDIEYSIRQLVEIALRALSPGMNDQFTAVSVIDHLSAAIAKIFEHALEPSICRDDGGKIRVVRTVSDYRGVLEAAFNQIRQAGASQPAILMRLIEALARLGPYIRSDDQRQAALDQLKMIRHAAEHTIQEQHDRDAFEQRYRAAYERLSGRPTQ